MFHFASRMQLKLQFNTLETYTGFDGYYIWNYHSDQIILLQILMMMVFRDPMGYLELYFLISKYNYF